MIILKIHSSVDVITNSSTVIFTYQDSISQVKELVDEIIKISGKKDISADDVFHYGVFCETYKYKDYIEDNDHSIEGYPKITIEWSTETKDEYYKQREVQDKWIEDLKLSIMKSEIEKPDWMTNAEEGDWSYDPDRYLNIIPKNEEYKDLADKLIKFLNSPDHEATRDG
jgi:predicted HTH transcriptional regulator